MNYRKNTIALLNIRDCEKKFNYLDKYSVDKVWEDVLDSEYSLGDYESKLQALEIDQEEFRVAVVNCFIKRMIEDDHVIDNDDALEIAKEAISEYYDYQELLDEGIWNVGVDVDTPLDDFDNIDANSMNYDDFEWDECSLLESLENNYPNSSNYRYIPLNARCDDGVTTIWLNALVDSEEIQKLLFQSELIVINHFRDAEPAQGQIESSPDESWKNNEDAVYFFEKIKERNMGIKSRVDTLLSELPSVDDIKSFNELVDVAGKLSHIKKVIEQITL
ncbi:hypothetical protein ACTJNK_13500 [Achromobacter anxifer]